jgi:hypothetical protein
MHLRTTTHEVGFNEAIDDVMENASDVYDLANEAIWNDEGRSPRAQRQPLRVEAIEA